MPLLVLAGIGALWGIGEFPGVSEFWRDPDEADYELPLCALASTDPGGGTVGAPDATSMASGENREGMVEEVTVTTGSFTDLRR